MQNPKITNEKILDILINHLKEEHNFSSEKIKELFEKNYVPVSIFKSNKLGPLECLVKYMKEDLELNYHDIAILLKRDDRTIWTSYNNASKKLKQRIRYSADDIFVPISIFGDRKLGILESLILHLKDTKGLRMPRIASILGRDNRIIWTTYLRAKKKC